jgi:uncharacterized membrane-anchored protein
MKLLRAIAALALLAATPAAAQTPAQLSPEQQQAAFEAKVKDALKRQHPQTGDVPIPAAKATLRLGEDYYFLNPEEAREVIVDFWGNPPAQANDVLGIVFPKGKTFADEDAWGAVITYEQTGYVKDDDAASTDYDELMDQMKSGEEENNKQRTEAGYPTVMLNGWAERPNYDRAHHSVVWARDLKFQGSEQNSLNYDVRLLGRFGVLSLNMISTMPHLAEVKSAAEKFGSSVTFDQGARYADYVPDVDKVAEYGVGGLVAAGAGLFAAKKLGLLAMILVFGKKLLIPLVLAFGVGWRWIKGLFGKREAEPVAEPYYPEEPAPVVEEAAPVETDKPATPS